MSDLRIQTLEEAVESLPVSVSFDEEDMSTPLGDAGDLQWLPLSKLVIDRRYQRDVLRQGAKTIRIIAQGFDWRKFQPLTVSHTPEVPGCYAILDGQHRALAALLHPDIDAVPCLVMDLDLRTQAAVFRDVNRTVTRIQPLQLFWAGLRAGEPSAVGIASACEQGGVTVNRFNVKKALMTPRQTVAVQGIGKMLKQVGFQPVLTSLIGLADFGERHVDLRRGTYIGATEICVLSRGIARAMTAVGVIDPKRVQDCLDDLDLTDNAVAVQERITAVANSLSRRSEVKAA